MSQPWTQVNDVVVSRIGRQLDQRISCSQASGQVGGGFQYIGEAWRTAEFHEREVFELFGVHFHNHPDLRKLILPDDWEGYPMRKDYEDPINMIKL